DWKWIGNAIPQLSTLYMFRSFRHDLYSRLSRKRQSPTTLVPVASSIPRALSYVRFDLLPPLDVGDSYEPYTEPDIEPDVKEDIDACIAFTDDIAARGTEVWTWSCKNYMITWWRSWFIESGLLRVSRKDQGHRIMVTSQQSAAMSEMISTLERDNKRLRGMLGVKR
nr:hypothetical protein [Tanacetum cinerariifolium]